MLITRESTRRYSRTALLIAGFIVPAVQAGDSDIKIDFNDEQITVSAERKPLSEVLIELGDQSNIRVTDADTIDVLFDGQVSGRNIEALLQALGVNSILVWNDASDDRKLQEIILVSVSEEGSDFLPAGSSAEEAATETGMVARRTLAPEAGVRPRDTASSDNPASSNTVRALPTLEDTEATPGFGFSIDPASATINPQQ